VGVWPADVFSPRDPLHKSEGKEVHERLAWLKSTYAQTRPCGLMPRSAGSHHLFSGLTKSVRYTLDQSGETEGGQTT